MTRTTARRLVLVTGTPRSGTTPVGDVLASVPGTRTLYEPLNLHVGDRRVSHYFEVPGAAGFGHDGVDALVRDVRRLDLRLRPGVFPEDRGLRRAVKRVTGSRTRMTYRQARWLPRTSTLVWKDPFAAFLAEPLAVRHGVPVVVTVRPAEAVAASFKRLGWAFDVPDLVRRLGATGMAGYRDLIGLGDPTDPVVSGATLWYVVNDALLAASARSPAIHLVDVEHLVRDPLTAYRRLFATLGLPWHRAAERHLDRTSAARGPARPGRHRAHVGRRDPTEVNRYWKDVLDPQETALVQQATGQLWTRLRRATT